MPEWMTSLEYSKQIALLLFFFSFIGIVLYVFTGKKRKARLESYKFIPLDDDENAGDKEGKAS